MENKYNKLIVILLFVFGIVFTIIGATFAYFGARANATGNSINGSSYAFNMNLDVSPVRTGNLIPVADDLISTSLAGNYKCEDQRDYGLCSLYRLRFTNSGSAESLVGYLQTISTTYRTSNLRYRLYDSNYTPISDIRTVSITPNDTNYFKSGSNNVDFTIPANGTKDYYLVIWIHDVNKNQLEDQNKLYNGRIVFTAKNGDKITSNFIGTGDSIKVTFDANGGELYDNLVYGLEDKAETSSIRMSYSISNGIVTVTANNDDGCGYTTGRVNLEAGKTYRFSAESDGAWCNGGNSDTVEAYLMLDGQTNTYYTMQAGNLNNNGYYEFTPTVSGTYWLRLDVNKNGETHQFWNISIKEKNTEPKIVTVGSTYGTLPTPTREGYTFLGWSTTDNILPNEYQEVEYIESTGTQYIDTGYKGNNAIYNAIADFKLIDDLPLSSHKAIFGTHVTANPYIDTFSFLGIPSTQKFLYKYGGAGFYSKKDVDNNRHLLEYYLRRNIINVVLDGMEIRSDNTQGGVGNYSMQYNIYLFAENRDDVAYYLSQMQLYSFKLYENNLLVRNFVPCYNKTTLVIGLYDTVTKSFYTNSGSGTFIKGIDNGYTLSSTVVNVYKDHTLKAIWEPIS